MKLRHYFIFSILFLISCNEPDETPVNNEVLNESSEFAVCNSIITDCRNKNVPYCLMGFKWGEGNPLPNSGYVVGPQQPGGTLTFSFQESNGLVNTHAQVDLPSLSFNNLPSCAKQEFRNAMNSWEEVANISIIEVQENSQSDIRIFVAAIRQSGVGYPNFPSNPCVIMGGDLIIQADLSITSCDTLYKFFLHEIGHVLGLGHVGTNNIMAADFQIFDDLDGLQNGDISGLIHLYGPK